jgi:hypothetical protein
VGRGVGIHRRLGIVACRSRCHPRKLSPTRAYTRTARHLSPIHRPPRCVMPRHSLSRRQRDLQPGHLKPDEASIARGSPLADRPAQWPSRWHRLYIHAALPDTAKRDGVGGFELGRCWPLPLRGAGPAVDCATAAVSGRGQGIAIAGRQAAASRLREACWQGPVRPAMTTSWPRRRSLKPIDRGGRAALVFERRVRRQRCIGEHDPAGRLSSKPP